MSLDILNKAFEASRDGMVITTGMSDNFKVIYANPAFVKLTGYERDEILGRNCRFLQSDDRSQPEIKYIKESLMAGKECHCRIRNYKKNGKMFWNELSLSPVLNAQGEPEHYIAFKMMLPP